MSRPILRALALVLVAGCAAPLAASGCSGGSADDLCALLCDCEHCNDRVEREACDQYAADLESAKAYGCDSQWTALADCVQEKGVCDEKAAFFSTAENAKCNEYGDTGLPCSTDSACAPLGIEGAACIEGSCKYTVCACSQFGDSGFPCGSDAECTSQGFGAGSNCLTGTCRYCINGAQQCVTSADCPATGDVCDQQRKALVECEKKASALPQPFGGTP